MAINWKTTTVLITGGTGSFGQAFTRYLLAKRKPRAIRIFSRDEFKQYQMQQDLPDKRLRFLLGDVRDKDRLARALSGADIVVHAAALKQIPLGEYNPSEVVKTNVLGTMNVVEAVLDSQVKQAILISSDKAAYPINLYGASKMCAEKLFIQGNVYLGKAKGVLAVIRYGNVLGSRGSVVPIFRAQKKTGQLTITDERMTRFWITLPQACQLVDNCLAKMRGGEIFVPKLPSVKVVDLAKVIAPRAKLRFTGVRPGEKLHEVLITKEESVRLKEYKNHYVIKPEFPFWGDAAFKEKRGRPRKPFVYRSDLNKEWLNKRQLEKILQ